MGEDRRDCHAQLFLRIVGDAVMLAPHDVL
jgi:hypothetical protein